MRILISYVYTMYELCRVVLEKCLSVYWRFPLVFQNVEVDWTMMSQMLAEFINVMETKIFIEVANVSKVILFKIKINKKIKGGILPKSREKGT